MSDYYGAATLEDWLKEEVFAQNAPVPAEVVAHFEEWREDIERNIEAWMNSDDGDGNNLSWRGWGRGFNAISDEDTVRFEELVAKLRPQAKSAAPYASLLFGTGVPIHDTADDYGRDIAGIQSMDPDTFAQYDGETWWRQLRDAVINEKNSQALCLIDSLPQSLKYLKHVGQTHVIVEHPDHMTEDMVDASRSLLLYTDTFSTHDAAHIRELLSMRGWTKRHLPEWFQTYEGHLTKAGRASLAYHLTVMAAMEPPVPEEKHFSKRRPQPLPGEQRLWITLRDIDSDKELCFGWAYETNIFSNKAEVLDIQINRHQLPEPWRHYFKKQAIDISARVVKGEDKLYRIEHHKVRMGVKAGFAQWLEIEIDDGVERYKQERNQ